MALPSQELRGATAAVAVTASDSTDLGVTRGVWVGGAGNLAVMFVDQTTAVTLTGVPAGTLLPIQVQKVMSTNTTATSITALY
jgi:hypothetical protein